MVKYWVGITFLDTPHKYQSFELWSPQSFKKDQHDLNMEGMAHAKIND